MIELEKVEKFKTWLVKQGAIVLAPTKQHEVVRFKTGGGISTIYRKGNEFCFVGEAHKAYNKFLKGEKWRTVRRKRKQLRDIKPKLAARDGKKCFACGEKLPFDKLTIEHLLNFSHGGNDHQSNLALVCKECGELLGNKPITKKIEVIQKIREKGKGQV